MSIVSPSTDLKEYEDHRLSVERVNQPIPGSAYAARKKRQAEEKSTNDQIIVPPPTDNVPPAQLPDEPAIVAPDGAIPVSSTASSFTDAFSRYSESSEGGAIEGQLLDLNEPDPISTELNSSLLSDGIEEEENDTGFIREMGKALEFITVPIQAIGQANLAYLGHDYETDFLDNPLDFVGEAVGAAYKGGKETLLHKPGTPIPEYGIPFAKKLLPEGTNEHIITGLGLALDIGLDPSTYVGVGTVKALGRIVKEAHGTFKVAELGIVQKIVNGTIKNGEGDGIFTEGVRELITRSPVKLESEALGEIGKLAAMADANDPASIKALHTALTKNPVTNTVLKSLEVEDALTNVAKVLGSPSAPVFAIKGVGSTQKLTLATANDITTSVIENINVTRINSPKDVDILVDNIRKSFEGQFTELFGKGNVADIALDQQKLLAGVVGDVVVPLSAVDSFALRQALTASAESIHKLSAKIVPGTKTPLDKMAYNKAIATHMVLLEKATGVSKGGVQLLKGSSVKAISGVERLDEINALLKVENTGLDIQVRKQFEAMFTESNSPIVINRMLNQISKKPSWARKSEAAAFEIYSNVLLAGLGTHVVNFTSNTANLAWSPTQKFLEGMSSAARLDFTKASLDVKESGYKFVGLMGGLSDTVRYLGHKWSSGKLGTSFEELNLSGKLRGTHQQDEWRKHKAISTEVLDTTGLIGHTINYMGKGIRVPGAALVDADVAFKIMHYRMEIAGKAARSAAEHGGSAADKRIIYKRLKDNPTQQVVEEAVDLAKYYTFTKELGNMGQKAQALLKQPGMRFLVPYFQTPTNIVKQGLERTVGTLRPSKLRDLVRISGEGGAKGDVARAQLAMGMVLPASIAYYLGDNISGTINTTSSEGRFRDEYGIPKYSIEILGKWTSYERLEPFRSILGLMVNANEMYNNIEWVNPDTGEQNPMVQEIAAVVANAFVSTVGDSYILGSVGNVVNVLEAAQRGDGEPLERLLAKTAKSLNPLAGIAKNVDKFNDEPFRQATTLLEGLQQGIPGLSSGNEALGIKALSPRITTWGDEQHHPHALGPDFISSFYTRGAELGYIEKELTRLEVPMPEMQKKMTVSLPDNPSISLDLTHNQSARLSIIRGKELGTSFRDIIGNVITDPGFKSAPDVVKKEIIVNINTEINKDAIMKLLSEDLSLQEMYDVRRERYSLRRQGLIK